MDETDPPMTMNEYWKEESIKTRIETLLYKTEPVAGK